MAIREPVSTPEPGSTPSLSVVPITPPVEATLRILLNSVPFLMGAAVVRQPPGNDAIIAQVGRMPWLHDRRLTTLELPDDTLPSNRAVALDWPGSTGPRGSVVMHGAPSSFARVRARFVWSMRIWR